MFFPSPLCTFQVLRIGRKITSVAKQWIRWSDPYTLMCSIISAFIGGPKCVSCGALPHHTEVYGESVQPLADATDVLVAPLDQKKSPLQLSSSQAVPLPAVQGRGRRDCCPSGSSRLAFYANVVRLVTDAPWQLTHWDDHLCQGPVYHPALSSLA